MKKTVKKGMSATLAVVLVLAIGVTALLAASKDWSGAKLGDLSQYYETGNSADPGYISTVAGDSGGTSYGIYMFASNAGTPLKFIEWLQEFPEGDVYRTMGDLLYNAYAYNSAGQYYPGYGSNFNATWTGVAEAYPTQFLQAQKDYWAANPYAALLNNLKASYPAFDVEDYSIALENVLWSRSVQHGVEGATRVIKNAFSNLGGFKMQGESTIIRAVYEECSKLDVIPETKVMTGTTAEKYGVSGQSMAYYSANSGAVQMSVYRRLHVNEPADALVMLYDNSDATVANGVYRLQRSGEPNQLLTEGENHSVYLGAGSDFRVTHYADEWYSITNDAGLRLAESSGSVCLQEPAASYVQFWYMDGNLLRNCKTGNYLSVSEGTLCTVSEEKRAVQWQRIAQNTVLGEGLFYPGSESGITNTLVAGASSFPVRGVIYSAVPISNVKVTVSGTGSFTASASPNSTYFDIWDLDDKCTFSKLTEGTYSLSITATAGGSTVTLAESSFRVDKNTSGITSDETFTVKFVDGSTTTTRIYHLGDTYGELPEPVSSGFRGWYLADGTEIAANSMVAGENHTVTAKYGELHTVKFVVDGETVKTLKLGEGEVITAPKNPLKSADSEYTYSFSKWVDDNGEKYVAGYTYMGTSDVTYTAVFTKTANTGTTTADSKYLAGISPDTAVSTLTGSGYTVYNGSSKVTSGTVATGMTATSGKTTVTIVVTGDTNGDGKLSITDIMLIRSHLLAKSSLTGCYAEAADVNGDGKISITDAVFATSVTLGRASLS